MIKKVLVVFSLINLLTYSRTVGLEEAISLALENGKSIKIAEKNTEISKYALRAAFKSALPSVVYEGKYQSGEYERSFNEGRYGTQRMETGKEGYNHSISLNQTLYKSGAILAGIKTASVLKSNDILSYIAKKSEVRVKVIETYSGIIQNQNDLDALRASKAELEARYERQKVQLNLSIITKTDVLKTEYALFEVEANIIGALNNIQVFLTDLKFQIGLEKELELKVKPFVIPDNLTAGINFEKDLQLGKVNSVAALKAKNSVEIAKANKTISRSEFLPVVTAFGNYGTFTENRSFDDSVEKAEWRAGVGVKWNIFQFGKNYDQYKMKALEQEKQIINEKLAGDDIDKNITSSYLNLIKIEKIKESRYKAMLAAEENFSLDSERYEVGILSTIDFLASESQMRESRVGYNEIISDYYVAFEKYRSLLI